MEKLISIITPTYNSERFIGELYESILNQTHQNWEWLVTDDCSTDRTFDILLRLSGKDPRVIPIKNNINSGAAVSRNNSLKRCHGEFIAFVDSDDLWHPEKLRLQLDFMGDEKSFSFTAYRILTEQGVDSGKRVDTNHNHPLSYTDMLKKKATLGCSTVMLRRNVIEDLTMPLLRTGQDYAFWLKILKTGVNAYAFTKVLTDYRIVAGSISRNKFKKAKRQWQIYREIESLSFPSSLYCFSFYAWRAIFRR